MLRKAAFASVVALALLLRAEPYLAHGAVMGVDAFYHMRLIEDPFIHDALYAGGRTALYPPLFHLVMHAVPCPVRSLAIIVPPLLSTAAICSFAYMLRDRPGVAITGSFMLALHPALIARTYFIPEVLAIALAPILYAWLAEGRSLRTGVMTVAVVLTHTFSTVVYLATLVTASGHDRLVRLIAIVSLIVLGALVVVQGPSVSYVRPPFVGTFVLTIAVYLPLAAWGRPRGVMGRVLLIGAAVTLVLSLVVPREVATNRMGAIGAIFICGLAAYGLMRVYEHDRNIVYGALVLFLALGLSVGLARTPIYVQQDRAAADHLGEFSASPVMTTSGHLAAYHGATVLVDEYAEFSPHYGERQAALYDIVLRASTDYRVPSEAGVRYIHVERSATLVRPERFSCLYDDGAHIYLFPT
jgi:hypothetical protein